jgi:hypothetical protein
MPCDEESCGVLSEVCGRRQRQKLRRSTRWAVARTLRCFGDLLRGGEKPPRKGKRTQMQVEVDDSVFAIVTFFVLAFVLGIVITINVRGCTERNNYQWHVEKMAATKPE